ncbi:hypothetical protein [Limnoraphis robusta]|uniref:Uncharacterized protein n=1 Tax=Limnoraphis robusta CS-951 TaxID=1637645 RepID=A0A0F5Y9I9_9CYAN|nr:hypothetical protein [Limnoraphis robusta]KKD35448.1 hypothetical protein WN50_25095 [Limnoraphis robusta CS-951]
MERGLLWLPLLIVFFGLAWSGWNEYQKVEAYREWAKTFEKAKYDIYAVLGLKGTELTWGKPTRTGPINLLTLSLEDVQSIWLVVDHHSVDLDSPPEKGKEIELEFQLKLEATPVRVPFTEIPLAAQWGKFLNQQLEIGNRQ